MAGSLRSPSHYGILSYMINYNLQEFRKTILKANNSFEPVYFKNFIDKNNLPSWSDFLNCIYQEWQEPTNQDLANTVAKNNEELHGTVIITKDLYLNALNSNDSNFSINEKFQKYFPEIFKIAMQIEEESGIHFNLAGPKICVGPHQSLSHKDTWAGFSLQCEGKTTWVLSDKSLMGKEKIEYMETFDMSPGDLLFFPEGMYHQIEVSAPRASLQFNSKFN